MKRLFLMAFVTLFATAAIAGNPLKVVNGDKKFFKNAEGTVYLEVNYDGATFDGKMPINEKYTDIDAKTTISYNGFVEELEETFDDLKIVKNADDATYKMTIQVTKIDEFFNPMGWVAGPCIRLWGTLTVTNVKTGETMIVVDIDEIDGGSSPTVDRAFNDTFGELAKRLAKVK